MIFVVETQRMKCNVFRSCLWLADGTKEQKRQYFPLLFPFLCSGGCTRLSKLLRPQLRLGGLLLRLDFGVIGGFDTVLGSLDFPVAGHSHG
jgi:hypothetical protein